MYECCELMYMIMLIFISSLLSYFQVGCIVLIHVPDSTLQQKCHIISHILVTNKGQAHDLQVKWFKNRNVQTSEFMLL